MLSEFLVLKFRVLVSEILVGHLLLKGGFQVVKLDAADCLAIFIGDPDLPLELSCFYRLVFTIYAINTKALTLIAII